MDTIKEFTLKAESGKQRITVLKNSRTLSARVKPTKPFNGDFVISVAILVDLDTNEFETKDFMIFQPEDMISDNMKADFIGSDSDHYGNLYFVFEILN